MTKMVKYLIELPDSFDPEEMKLNGFTLADRRRAERELAQTLSTNIHEIAQKLTDEIDEQLAAQKMKLNAKVSKEEAVDELRRTEALLDARAHARNR